MNRIRNRSRLLYQLINYFWVGGVAAIVNIASLFILTDLVGLYYIYSNILSFILGLTVNYILSKEFVFTENVEINYILEFSIYGLIGIIGIGVDTFVLWLFTSKFGIYYMLSKIISTGVTFIWNFSARKLIYVYLEK